jgi:hypothetical protein
VKQKKLRVRQLREPRGCRAAGRSRPAPAGARGSGQGGLRSGASHPRVFFSRQRLRARARFPALAWRDRERPARGRERPERGAQAKAMAAQNVRPRSLELRTTRRAAKVCESRVDSRETTAGPRARRISDGARARTTGAEVEAARESMHAALAATPPGAARESLRPRAEALQKLIAAQRHVFRPVPISNYIQRCGKGTPPRFYRTRVRWGTGTCAVRGRFPPWSTIDQSDTIYIQTRRHRPRPPGAPEHQQRQQQLTRSSPH